MTSLSLSNTRATSRLLPKFARVPIETAAERTRKGKISLSTSHVTGLQVEVDIYFYVFLRGEY